MHGKVQEGECIPWFLHMSDIFKDVFKRLELQNLRAFQVIFFSLT